MDDFTLSGPEDVVDRDIAVMTSTGTSLGLHPQRGDVWTCASPGQRYKVGGPGLIYVNSTGQSRVAWCPVVAKQKPGHSAGYLLLQFIEGYQSPESHRGP